MCMQCVAQSGPYIAGAFGGLRLMGRSSRRRVTPKSVEAPTVRPSASYGRMHGASARKRRRVLADV
jgi:hypothetical protein